MKEDQKHNLKYSLSAISTVASVIGVRLIDQYIYDMTWWVGLIFVVVLNLMLYKIIDSVPKLDKEISNKNKWTINISTIALIGILFFTFNL